MSDSVQAVTSSCGLLAAIRTPACALAVWPEAIALPELAPGWSRRMHAWREPLQPELADPDAIWAAVDAEPSAALMAALQQFIDVAASIHGARPFELRIDVISSTMCRWFHADQVALRLLLTLAGAGTECLPVPTAIRAGLSSGLQAAPAGWTPLTCQAGDLILMKGDRYPGASGLGLLHRSPPASPEAPRLLLAADLSPAD